MDATNPQAGPVGRAVTWGFVGGGGGNRTRVQGFADRRLVCGDVSLRGAGWLFRGPMGAVVGAGCQERARVAAAAPPSLPSRAMRRWGAALVVALAFVAGCGDTFDEDGWSMVRGYIEDQVPAVDSAQLLGSESEARELADRIDAINRRWWDDPGWPSESDMTGWRIRMTQGDQEWSLDGEEIADAVFDLEFASDWLAEALRGEHPEPEAAGRAAREAVDAARRLISR